MKKPASSTQEPPDGARTIKAKVEFQRGSTAFWLSRRSMQGLDDPLCQEGSQWAFSGQGRRWAVQEIEVEDPEDSERVIVTREFMRDSDGDYVSEPCQASGTGAIKNWVTQGGIALLCGDLWEVSALDKQEVDLTVWPSQAAPKPPMKPPAREFVRKRVLRRIP